MSNIKMRHLFHMALRSGPQQVVGQTPNGERRIAPVLDGAFEGERLRGVFLCGGSDWITVRPDRVWELNVRLALKTDEGDLVAMSYRGLRHGPADVLAKVHRGEQVGRDAYYFRAAFFLKRGPNDLPG